MTLHNCVLKMCGSLEMHLQCKVRACKKNALMYMFHMKGYNGHIAFVYLITNYALY